VTAPKLHKDWRRILRRAWSVRLMLLSAALSAVSASLPIAQPYLDASPLVIAAAVGLAGFVAAVAALVARIVKQQGS
jgi:hypothetical protein